MSDVVARLWGFCHTLRHDGIDYGDYIEQITYLLFLKMADERAIELPEHTDWAYLRTQSGTELTDTYTEALRLLGRERGILGDIFSGAQSRFSNPVNLKKLIGLIDETEWTSLDVDVKAAAFEGLLERAAAEGKKGAGQYFTPRLLIQSIVRCMKPDPRTSKDFAIGDPACGTGGFLVVAYEWLIDQTKGALDRELARRVRHDTYFGQELVARPRRLALMNLYLHQVEPHIALGDSIYEAPSAQRFDVVLTNPPFGTRGANQAPDRDDFVVQTSNKQLNFIQHVLTTLKPGGRSAIVVPDNVLFADQAGDVFKVLMEDCDLHTVLRLPRGTFHPYSPGTNTNVVFFTKGQSTESTWIYDGRANVPKITKKDRPLTAAHFADFEHCYGDDPNGRAARSESDSPQGRWRQFDIREIKEAEYKLDAFRWLRDNDEIDLDQLPRPTELITEAISSLDTAKGQLSGVLELLEPSAVREKDGWRECRIGDVAKVVGGGTPKTSVEGNFSDEGGHPWITPSDLTGYTEKYISHGRRFLTDQGLSTSSAKYIPAGSVLFSTRAPIGYVAIAEVPVTTNQGFRSFVPTEEVDPEFLYYVLRLLKPVAEQMASGTTFPELSGSNAARLPLSLPPLDTQREIIARLDEAFARRSDAVVSISQAGQALDRLTAALLHGALGERLVPQVENGGPDKTDEDAE